MKEWDQNAVKIVIESINEEIKSLETFNCYQCINFLMNNKSNNDICKKCRIEKNYKKIKCNERLQLWKNRLKE